MTMIEENCIIRPRVKLGVNVTIKCGSILGTGVKVGSNCYIGPGAILLHEMPDGKSKPCVLEEGVFIGAGAIVLPGVIICTGTIIGAGSVVTKSVVVAGTYAGNPCRKISDTVYIPS